jgi:N-acetylated-alpha-linked acidic dipeptidase
MAKIGDPSFQYHATITKVWGVTALRLANADILPLDFAVNAASLQEFLADLEKRTQDAKPPVSLQPLHDHLAQLAEAGRALRDATLVDLQSGKAKAHQLQYLNERLGQVESNGLDPAGIPDRPWFQHLLYAARYTYAHLEFPGLTEAMERGDWAASTEQAAVLDAAVVRNTEFLRATLAGWQARQ